MQQSSGDKLKAGPPDVAGRPRGQECQRYVLGGGGGGWGCHSKVGALAASLPGCLSVASASLPPCTLSHFSPMSLLNQGGGDEKEREKEVRKVNREEEGEERMATFGLQQSSVN